MTEIETLEDALGQALADYDDAEEALVHHRATIRRLAAELKALRAGK